LYLVSGDSTRFRAWAPNASTHPDGVEDLPLHDVVDSGFFFQLVFEYGIHIFQKKKGRNIDWVDTYFQRACKKMRLLGKTPINIREDIVYTSKKIRNFSSYQVLILKQNQQGIYNRVLAIYRWSWYWLGVYIDYVMV
jgi:hypothetical protein